jgi:hypothetical protein
MGKIWVAFRYAGCWSHERKWESLFSGQLLEAGLFESKIRICYVCVHLGRFTKEISSSH